MIQENFALLDLQLFLEGMTLQVTEAQSWLNMGLPRRPMKLQATVSQMNIARCPTPSILLVGCNLL